jgi:hypothetical protein
MKAEKLSVSVPAELWTAVSAKAKRDSSDTDIGRSAIAQRAFSGYLRAGEKEPAKASIAKVDDVVKGQLDDIVTRLARTIREDEAAGYRVGVESATHLEIADFQALRHADFDVPGWWQAVVRAFEQGCGPDSEFLEAVGPTIEGNRSAQYLHGFRRSLIDIWMKVDPGFRDPDEPPPF